MNRNFGKKVVDTKITWELNKITDRDWARDKISTCWYEENEIPETKTSELE